MLERFCREPYRVFFPLGIMIGLYGVGHWLFYGLGWIKNYSGLMHAFIQMQGYLGCFIIGFLLTAMPRLASAPTATKRELFSFLVLTLGIPVFLSYRLWPLADLFFILWLLSIACFAVKRILVKRETKVSPPTEFVWIPIGILNGVIGSSLLALGHLALLPAWALSVGKPMVFQGFLFSIVLGVGGFLGPRLMGVQQLIQPENIRKEEPCVPGMVAMVRKRRIQVHLTAGILLFLSFWFEGLGAPVLAYGLRAIIVSGIFLFTGALPLVPRVRHAFTWLLWLSFWMVALGSWVEFLFPSHRVIALHLVFLGGFSLMTFAVGTVVVLSHAGEVQRLYKPLPILWFVASCVLGALGLRISADFFPAKYFNLLALAAVIWMTGALSWLLFILPRIFRTPGDWTFEREHQKSKGSGHF